MEWFNSFLTPNTNTLTHSFACPVCGATKNIYAKQDCKISPANDPAYGRMRAEEIRKAAKDTGDPDTTWKLVRLADEYDKLAERALLRLMIASRSAVGAMLAGTALAALARNFGF